MGKSEQDLKVINNSSNKGSHEVLINQIKSFVQSKSQNDRAFYNDILQLKRLRVNADYDDISIDYTKSNQSISLSKSSLSILKKCI